MDCAHCLEIVSADLDAETTAEERRAADAHLATCADCARTADALRAHARSARLRSPIAAPDLTTAILATGSPQRPRRRLTVGALAAASVVALAGAALALRSDDGALSTESMIVRDARASVGRDGGVAEVYFYLANDGEADRVLAVTSPRAELAQIHVTETSDGIETMRTVESLPLPEGSSARLAPRGVHVMLVGLRGDVTPGDSVPITLVLEHGGVVTLSAVASSEPMTS